MKSFSAQGIILKRSDTGELDRIVTMFTRDRGKLTCVAKGSRRLTSSKLASLEPGCLITAHFAVTKSMPILTQTRLLDDFMSLKTDLNAIRNLFQILEMVDAVLAEGDAQPETFSIIVELLSDMGKPETNKTTAVRRAFGEILAILGFTDSEKNLSIPLQGVIEELTSRKLKAFAFLTNANGV